MRTTKRYASLLVTIFILAGALSLAACSSFGGASTGGTSSSGNNGGNSSANGQTATGILAKVKQANLKDSTFTLQEQETSGSSTISASGTGKLVTQPFREDVSVMAKAGNQQIASEVLTDGSNVYVKTGTGNTWMQLPASQVTGGAGFSTALNDIANLPNAQLIGSETANGIATWHLRGTPTRSFGGQSGMVTEDMWVNKSTYQPVRITDQAATSRGTVNSNITFTDWNTGVTVTPPPTSAVTSPSIPTTPAP